MCSPFLVEVVDPEKLCQLVYTPLDPLKRGDILLVKWGHAPLGLSLHLMDYGEQLGPFWPDGRYGSYLLPYLGLRVVGR